MEPATLRRVGPARRGARAGAASRRRAARRPRWRRRAAEPAAGLGALGRARRPYGGARRWAAAWRARARGRALGGLVLAGSLPRRRGARSRSRSPRRRRWPRPCCRGSAGSLAALALCGWLATAGGPPGHARSCSPPALRRCRCCCRARACSGRCPCSRPLLGTVALGPGLRGRRRARADAAGAAPAWRRPGCWLARAAAEALTGEALLFGIAGRRAGRGSTGRARSPRPRADALGPLLTSPALAPLAGLGRAGAWCSRCVLRGRWLGGRPAWARRLWAAGAHGRHAALGDSGRRRGALTSRAGRWPGRSWARCVAVAISQIGAPGGALAGPAGDHRLGLPCAADMSVLRNLEAKLGGLVEGAFGRAFKTSVQPVELAHKLAKEMEENQMASVSRVYVPNHYRVFLSPAGPRAVRELRAGAPQGAVRLPARARAPGAPRAHQPPAGRVPHRRAARPRRVRHPGPAARAAGGGAGAGGAGAPRRRRATSGTRWSTRPTGDVAPARARRTTAARRCSWATAGATC